MDESAFRQDLQESRFVGAHALPPVAVACFGPVV
jgi:hypothetical protein